jgi:hypothetical protein
MYSVASYLLEKEGYHVVMPDLPGHGRTVMNAGKEQGSLNWEQKERLRVRPTDRSLVRVESLLSNSYQLDHREDGLHLMQQYFVLNKGWTRSNLSVQTHQFFLLALGLVVKWSSLFSPNIQI